MKLLLHHYLKTSADTPVDRDIRAQIAAGNYEDHSATRGIRGALNTLLSINASTELTLHKKLAFNQRWYELVGSYSQGALTKQMDKLIAISGGAGCRACRKDFTRQISGRVVEQCCPRIRSPVACHELRLSKTGRR